MSRIFTSLAAGSFFAAAAVAQSFPHYTVRDLGTLGGPGTNSSGYQMNNAGWVAGSSNLVSGGPQHAYVWFGGGPLVDLGTLDGAACPGCSSGADGPNLVGEAAIGSEISKFDPNGEDFCAYGTHHVCLAAVWGFGRMIALPNLPGGNNANAFGINNRGQLVGFAETGVSDPDCAKTTPFQMLRYQAVIWEPSGQIRQLSPLTSKGDTISYAMGINDHGQAVGSSGTCLTEGLPPANVTGLHAVLWQADGTPTYLGTLGDAKNTGSNNASSINNRGHVVGTSQFTDGSVHSFLWTQEFGMHDIGTLPGAAVTVASCCNTINNKDQVVGFSLDGETFDSTAFLWQNNAITDLNKLIPAGTGWDLQSAASINDAGEITGQGTIKGELHAFLLVPVAGSSK